MFFMSNGHVAQLGRAMEKKKDQEQRIGKYLRVQELEGMHPEIINNDDEILGTIEYRNGWRQFVFCPKEDIQFNHRCLTDIAAYLMKLNKTKGAYKEK